MKPFENASYLSQVHRLRDMAGRALQCYGIRAVSCSLITHWENTTFQVTTTIGKRFLLRIHRPGYHTEAAILEELTWLERLSAARTLRVPVPIRSRSGRLVESVASPQVPQRRYCCVLQWIDGHFIRRSLNVSHLRKLGGVIARLHGNAEGLTVVHRKYWDAEGLVGENPKFGSIDRLEGISRSAQDIVTQARLLVLSRLKQFEREFPHKQSLIHADLHFDNLLVARKDLAVIDFDDCGLGFHAYDLAVSLTSTGHGPYDKKSDEYSRLKDALIEGYSRERGWAESDEEILPFLIAARRLAMLGWLNSRSDNSLLKKRIKGAVARTVKHLRKAYGL
jgi:Ser/Thr protein kinase RdoA (MazF antagonist)